MARLKIGSVTALLTPDDITVVPDDRRELVKTVVNVGGAFHPSVAVVDGGLCSSGVVMRLSGVKFGADDFATVQGYSDNRTAVAVTDASGSETAGCTVKLTQWTQSKKFSAVTCDLEVWRL